MLFALEVQELKKGDVIEDSVKRLEKKYYKVGIDNLKNIHVTLTNMTKDIDLYLKTETYSDVKDNTPIEQRVPTIRKNDCYSSNGRGIDEECNYRVVGPAPGDYDANVYILVYGFEAGSYRLEVKEEEAEKIDSLSEEPLRGKVEKGESKQYKIYGKAGETILTTLFRLTGDADLRVKIGRKANLHTFDCKSINGGTKTDSCSVTLKRNNTVYVNVYGYKGANYSIKGTILTPNEKKALLSKAKKHCLNQKNSTSKILCSNEENKVYIIESENQGYQFNNKFYKIDISTDQVTFLRAYAQSGNQVGAGDSFFPINQLKNTNMFLINDRAHSPDWSGSISVVNPKGVSVRSFSYYEFQQELPIFRTIENGQKLTVEEKEGRAWENPKHTLKTYDISDTSNIKLISNIKL
jgi:uncharacterized protein YpmS